MYLIYSFTKLRAPIAKRRLITTIFKNHSNKMVSYPFLHVSQVYYTADQPRRKTYQHKYNRSSQFSQYDFDIYFDKNISEYNLYDVIEKIKAAGKKNSFINIDIHLPKINAYFKKTYIFEISQLTCLHYGLANITTFSPDVVVYISNLTSMYSKCKGPFTAIDCAQSLYGLKNISSSHMVVRPLLRELTNKISSCTESFKSAQIASCLYGLQSMSMDCYEVINLVKVLIEKVHTCQEPLEAHHMAMALYGFR